MSGHLKTDELIDRLYGLEDQRVVDQDVHLANCTDCQARWEAMRVLKGVVSAPQSVSSDFLAAQRRKIYARLGEEPRTRMAWAPALAAVALVAIGVAVYRPLSAPAPGFVKLPGYATHESARPAQMDAADAQLFSEVYSMQQAMEPSVAAPIHTLFEDNQ
jgi:predicted anti-sigma-YlaC factor YlaD